MRWRAEDGRVLQGWLGGDPDGPLVAVLHGCPDTRHVAMTGDEAAGSAGVRLLCVNRPGYGESTVHASSHASVADDLASVVGELGHERFAVLGMSVGGAYAVACAARHPHRVAALGLVATQPPGSRSEPVEELVVELAPEFLAWRSSVDPDDADDERLAARCALARGAGNPPRPRGAKGRVTNRSPGRPHRDTSVEAAVHRCAGRAGVGVPRCRTVTWWTTLPTSEPPTCAVRVPSQGRWHAPSSRAAS